MDTNNTLPFGELVFGDFPFDDGGSKKRWVFVLKDYGDTVAVAYCTSNPEIQGAVRLGALADGKVTNLVAYRYEVVQKIRLQVGRTQRVPLPVPGVGDEVLGSIRRAAKTRVYPKELSEYLMSLFPEMTRRGQAQFQKIAARKAAYKGK